MKFLSILEIALQKLWTLIAAESNKEWLKKIVHQAARRGERSSPGYKKSCHGILDGVLCFISPLRPAFFRPMKFQRRRDRRKKDKGNNYFSA